ncbi:MAG: DNA translocase FtsK 4TM domain-containing protein [Nitrospira sp.]|nr:DNA translocase FtsK 4TM domain-containing protein [Nitrospira sp.]MCA9474876.1 DNA translocase FtsK 4TM domain-containing protein [Nitrospira sp.]MCB9711739.1 DNA translocase FtsK 4TM domain-containing protein [Nitrospiraceae bacterium]MDR4488675.1 DNA translocase FtsK 4TM domain-containing protein [Nitrospirales bacterium]
MSIFPNNKNRQEKAKPQEISLVTTQVVGVVFLTLGVLCGLSVLTFFPDDPILFDSLRQAPGKVLHNAVGLIGSTLAFSLFELLGGAAYLIPLFLLSYGIACIFGERIQVTLGALAGAILGLLSVSALLHLQSPGLKVAFLQGSGFDDGGLVGQWLAQGLEAYLATTGATIFLLALVMVGFLYIVPVSIGRVARQVATTSSRVTTGVVQSVREKEWWTRERSPKENKSIRINRQLAGRGGVLGSLAGSDSLESTISSTPLMNGVLKPLARPAGGQLHLEMNQSEDEPYATSAKISKSYQLPSPMELLDTHAARAANQTDSVLKSQSEILVQTLASFGIEGSVTDVHPGPVITMYEFAPGPGIKVARIVNLADDLAMALKALKVRVVAPLPNKSTVGVEVPNPQRETVGLKEMLMSEAFRKSRSKLALALGKDIFGRPVVADLRTMPHLLVAGATGAGKSVGINCVLLNLLFSAHPDEVKLLLIDPKVLELQVYDGIPHLIRPVITNPKEAARGLAWVVQEMERRYRILAELGVRSIDAYNRKLEEFQATGKKSFVSAKKSVIASGQTEGDATDGEESLEERVPLPYIVVVIDEFADLMMVAPKEIEDRIARLAQMARASGIHLILATQRPSVDVVTGLIKANFPARIAYQVSSKIDSRTILDANGAESLLGKGDMLYLASGTGRIVRLHGPFVSDDEVRGVVDWVKGQASPVYDPVALEAVQEPQVEEQERDETYERARELVMTTGQASASFIQRRLRVGYPRAARMIEQMEEEGLVSAAGRDGKREVLVRGTAIAELG